MAFREVIICEKGTQAKVFVKTLKLDKVKKIGKYPAVFYSETSNIAVVHQSGHLLEASPPEAYQPKLIKDGRRNWDLSLLPVIPQLDQWKLRLKDDSAGDYAGRITSLYSGIKWALVDNGTPDEITIAVDNDKEGELLGWEVLYHLNLMNHRKISRLIYSANTDEAIIKAYQNKHPGANWHSRYLAGFARSVADWVVGMNITMAFTTENRSTLPPYQAFNAGRVIFAIAYIIGLRHESILNFKPVDYFGQKVVFKTSKGETYSARLKYPDTWKTGEPPRMSEKSKADAINKLLGDKPEGKISRYDKNEKKKGPPIGFNRSGFERHMLKKYRCSLDGIGDAMQKLYSEKALITYPRVEVKNLDNTMHESMPSYIDAILTNLLSTNHLSNEDKVLYEKAKSTLDLNRKSGIWLSGVDEKESHHAIIPTNKKVNIDSLTLLEFQVYREICDRLLIQFMPDYIYSATLITTQVKLSQTVFDCESTGITPLSLGWKGLSKDELDDKQEGDSDDDTKSLPLMNLGETVSTIESQLESNTTKCPKPYTEAELIEDLENPSRFVVNKEILKRIKKLQIGTGGTRKDHIKGLRIKGFVTHVEEGKGKKAIVYLHPTEKLHALNKIAPDYFKLPETSAFWEDSFNAIQDKEMTVEQFMDRQKKIMHRFMQELSAGKFTLKKPASDKALPCSTEGCGGFIFPLVSKKGANYWSCQTCDSRWFDKDGKPDNKMGEMRTSEPRNKDAKYHTCTACKKGKAFFVDMSPKPYNLWRCDKCKTAFFDKAGQLGSQLKKKE